MDFSEDFDPRPEEDDSRDELGRFRPGKSGNPHGRPLGTKNFSTMVVEALATEFETAPGTTMSLNEYLSQVVAGILVNGTYRTLTGETFKISGRDLLPFLMSVWKKLEPGTTSIDLTTGGKAIDFSRLDDNELAKFIEGTIAGSIDGDSRSEETGIEFESPEHEDESGGVPAADSSEDVLLESESPSLTD